MKKFLKVFICVISSLVIAVVLMFCFMATRLWIKQERKYIYDVAEIYISHEYKDKFLNKEFKLEDFGIKNIKSIEYYEWSNNENAGIMFVRFENSRWYKLDRYIRKLEDLPFVVKAEKVLAYSLFDKHMFGCFFATRRQGFCKIKQF